VTGADLRFIRQTATR